MCRIFVNKLKTEIFGELNSKRCVKRVFICYVCLNKVTAKFVCCYKAKIKSKNLISILSCFFTIA